MEIETKLNLIIVLIIILIVGVIYLKPTVIITPTNYDYNLFELKELINQTCN